MKKIGLIPVLPKESKPLQVAAYCRVSTRSKEQKAGLFRQIWAYMNRILNHPNWEFAGIFYDFGKSGLRKRGRTGLEKTSCCLPQKGYEVAPSDNVVLLLILILLCYKHERMGKTV